MSPRSKKKSENYLDSQSYWEIACTKTHDCSTWIKKNASQCRKRAVSFNSRYDKCCFTFGENRGSIDMLLKAPVGAVRKKKRLGRGSGTGLGKTSGRGHKGQNSRSGGRTRPGFEGGQMPIYRRVASRGFSNYPFKKHYALVQLDQLSRVFRSKEVVDPVSLRKRGLVSKNASFIKILGRGNCEKPLTIRNLCISAGAKQKIEDAGGTVEVHEITAKMQTVDKSSVQQKAVADGKNADSQDAESEKDTVQASQTHSEEQKSSKKKNVDGKNHKNTDTKNEGDVNESTH